MVKTARDLLKDVCESYEVALQVYPAHSVARGVLEGAFTGVIPGVRDYLKAVPEEDEIKRAFEVIQAALDAHNFLDGVDQEPCPPAFLERAKKAEFLARAKLRTLRNLLVKN